MPRKESATYLIAVVMKAELEHGPALGVPERLKRVVAETLHDRCYHVLQDLEDNKFSRVRVKRVDKVEIEEKPRLV